ncbi:MAG: hypothetical protein AAGD28_26630 [Bacteroidota bacterium]
MKSLKLIFLPLIFLILASSCSPETALKDRDLLFENVTNSSSFKAYYDDHRIRKEILTRYNLSDVIQAEYASEEARIQAMEEKIKFSQEASILFEKLSAFQSRKVSQSTKPDEKLEEMIGFIQSQEVDQRVQEMAIDLLRHDASRDTQALANTVLSEFPSLTRMSLLEITNRYDAQQEQHFH